jgi:hypothetical protein
MLRYLLHLLIPTAGCLHDGVFSVPNITRRRDEAIRIHRPPGTHARRMLLAQKKVSIPSSFGKPA